MPTLVDTPPRNEPVAPRSRTALVAVVRTSLDSVAIDSVAAGMMGFDPRAITYLRMAEERGLGVSSPKDIDFVGEDVRNVNFGFETKKSPVVWGRAPRKDAAEWGRGGSRGAPAWGSGRSPD